MEIATTMDNEKGKTKSFSTVAPPGMFWHQDENGYTRLVK